MGITSKLKVTFFAFLLTCSSVLWGNEEIKGFIEKLPSEQRELLESFFSILVKDSLSGYVLYGDKPMCIEGHSLVSDSGALSGFNDQKVILIQGLRFWQDLNLSVVDKNYFFLIFNFGDYRHFVCVNRKAFIRVVNENLSLFRYVLGSTLTAESLLDELIRAKDGFYEVLKQDNVLLGILLGYGTKNALLVSRKEFISDAFAYDKIEDFPFVSRKDRMHRHVLPKAQVKRPSLGFKSLADEIKTIKQKTVVSRNLLPFDSLKIPYFGCDSITEETKTLLSRYELNRQEISKVLYSGNFLEQTLYKFLITKSKTLDIPKCPPLKPLVLPENKEEILAKIVYEEMRQEKYFQENFLAEFVKGMTLKMNREEFPHQDMDRECELYSIEKDLEGCENLQKSDAYFKKLSSQENLVSIIPNRICYTVMQKGEGNPASSKLSKVSFHYSFSLLDGQDVRLGTVVKEDVEHFIPGIARALIGMKKGEKREVYIHPEYGYGEGSYFPSNATLIANIELVDFEELDREAVISPAQKLSEKNQKELLSELIKINKSKYLGCGAAFWERYVSVIDFQSFKKHLCEAWKSKLSTAEPDQFLVDLEYISRERSVSNAHWISGVQTK
jgi:FKBP-type peptidyl-prolyl cis-trans isomerase